MDITELQAAVATLARTDRGRNAMRRLLYWLDDDGMGLDRYGQEAVVTVLWSAWGPFAGTARDLMREAKRKPKWIWEGNAGDCGVMRERFERAEGRPQ